MDENMILIDRQQVATRVGFVYDERMLDHKCTWDKNHIEIPDRLKRCYGMCKSEGLIDRCRLLESRLACEEDILSYHDKNLVQQVRFTADKPEEERMQFCQQFDDVYLNGSSFEASMLAAGCAMAAAEAVTKGDCKHAMALVRPPGHHAMVSEPNGFCYFNNVVIAAKKLLKDGLARKIAIIDWDVHHGQGTQRAFYESADVLYISIHRYEYGKFWPNLRESDVDYVGQGSGRGFNINIPLNETGCGDLEYIYIFLKIILPALLEFKPEIILVSAGYDAALGCPEGLMNVTPACYSHMTSLLTNISRVVCVLEGGYHLKSLELSVAFTLSALLGDVCPLLPALDFDVVKPCVKLAVDDSISCLSTFWKCFKKPALLANGFTMARKFIQIQIPDVFPCRNKYPPPDEDRIAHFDAVLDRLSKTCQVGRCKKVLWRKSNDDTENVALLKSICMKIFDIDADYLSKVTKNSDDFSMEITCGKNICSKHESTRALTIQISSNDVVLAIQNHANGRVKNQEFYGELSDDTYLKILTVVYSLSPDLILLNLKFTERDSFNDLGKKRLILALMCFGAKVLLNIIFNL